MRTYAIVAIIASAMGTACSYDDTGTSASSFWPPDAGADDGGHDAGCIIDESCGLCVHSTTFPTIGIGKMVILCSECGPSNCSDSDVPCDVYGAKCTVGNVPGVCAACCDSIGGRLRCVSDAPAALPGGASCDADTDCQSGACVPSPNTFGAGVCYSSDMVGCIKVGTSQTHGVCSAGAVYVCGDSWPTSTLGTCLPVMTGKAGELYQCCYPLHT